MEKYYFDTENKSVKEEKDEKITLALLKTKLNGMDVSANIIGKNSPYRATVVVQKNIGTAMFLASGSDDLFWLNKNAVKVENKGDIVKYHFVFD